MVLFFPFFIATSEIVFILFVAIIIFGANKIPDIARGMGKGIRTLKDATNDIKVEIQRSAENQGFDNKLSNRVTEEISKVKDEINDISESVQRDL